ncbi:hypothetical protein ACLOJK_020787 [Asimina triloba]
MASWSKATIQVWGGRGAKHVSVVGKKSKKVVSNLPILVEESKTRFFFAWSKGSVGVSTDWREKLADIPEASSPQKGQEVAFKVMLAFFKSNNIKWFDLKESFFPKRGDSEPPRGGIGSDTNKGATERTLEGWRDGEGLC